jgi:preprotein translocase subunit SecG
MSLLVIIIHVIVCIALIMTVLLQTGKGADMGAAFGGGSSNTLFGATGATTFLSKMTTAVAVIFMLTSLILAYLTANRGSSSMLSDMPAVEQPAPAPTEALPTAEQPNAPAATPSEGSKTTE